MKKDKKIFEEIPYFVRNFNTNLKTGRDLLEKSNSDSSQSDLNKIQDCIINMNSNLLQITELFKKTKMLKEYTG